MVSVRDKSVGSVGSITYWDVFYFCVFDRYSIFDIPTLVVIFIDGFSWRPIPLCLILHWVFRSLGSCMFAVAKFIFQDSADMWRYTNSVPSIGWYLGEMLLDSYIFQKAFVVAKSSSKLWLKLICFVGFVPVVLSKTGIVFWRYIAPFYLPTEDSFFLVFNRLDAIVILTVAWSDVLCCFVICYVALKNLTFTKDHFLNLLVQATELRLVLCSILSVFAASVLIVEGCHFDDINGSCIFDGVRNLAVDVVYSLYYLDYLIVKFHKIVHFEKKTTSEHNSSFFDVGTIGANRRFVKMGQDAVAPEDGRGDRKPRLSNDEQISRTDAANQIRRGLSADVGKGSRHRDDADMMELVQFRQEASNRAHD